VANTVKTDAVPEIIELIDDDTDAFGDRSSDVAIHDRGGPRWIGPVAAAALVGLIGFGVATSTDGTPRATPVSSTSIAAPSTVPATVPATVPVTAPPTIVPPQPTVPFYAADPPRELSVQSAQSGAFGNDFGVVGYELWATADASATTGSWFSITTQPGAPPVYAADSYRVQAGDLSIAMSHTTGGHALTQFTTNGHISVTIASFGWSDDDLLRLVASVQAGPSAIGFTDSWFAANHQLVSSVQPWLAVRGLPVEQVAYASSSDFNDAVVVTVSQPAPLTAGGSPADRQVALRFLLDRNTPFIVDGHSAVAGTVIGAGNYSIATWVAGDYIVTVGATLPVSQLITIARTVHEVGAPEWAGMQFQAKRSNSGGRLNNATPAYPLSSGTDANSEPWTIDVGMVLGDRPQIHWSWDGRIGSTTPLETTQINTVVDDQRTYVLVDLPRAVAPTAQLQVIHDGLDPVVVPFQDTDPSLDRTFAAYAFSEPGPFTAQVVADDGTILASWPAP
jgi:hypothetical protein